MTTTIAHRELRNKSGEVLRRVESGETFVVTNHGRIVAMLSPADSLPRPQMVAASSTESFAKLPLSTSTRTTQQLLDELRGER